MFWYKKENLYLGQFLRILAGMILRSDVRLPPNIDDILREQEIERIKAELSPFRFVILAFLLGEIKQFGKKHLLHTK